MLRALQRRERLFLRWSTMGPKHEKYLIFLSCSPVPLLYATPCCIHATMKLHQVVAMLVCVRDTADEVIKVTKMVRPKHVAPECAVVPTTMSPAAMHCVLKDGVDRKSFRLNVQSLCAKIWIGKAHVLDRRLGEVFVHYIGTDKRLDEWISADAVRATTPPRNSTSPSRDTPPPRRVNGTSTRKRRRSASPAKVQDTPETTQSPAALPTMASARRNFDKVNFGPWQIKTW